MIYRVTLSALFILFLIQAYRFHQETSRTERQLRQLVEQSHQLVEQEQRIQAHVVDIEQRISQLADEHARQDAISAGSISATISNVDSGTLKRFDAAQQRLKEISCELEAAQNKAKR